MTRREWAILFLCGAGCGGGGRALEEMLPATLAGGWTLKEAAPAATGEAPEFVRGLGLRRAVAAVYEGSGRAEVTVYEMTSNAGAFEVLQKWRTTEGEAHFHHERYFVVVKSPEAGREALFAFAEGLEEHLKR